MIQFLLNRTLTTIEDARPDMTALDFVRTQCNKRGTKEGCASGDCGACTVVIAEPDPKDESRLIYRSANACILFAGALHGTQLLTVEDLQSDGQLHLVQKALVECHGSQCGFCTPGIVMSMFGLFKNAVQCPELVSPITEPNQPCDLHKIRRATIEQYLGGNLCRCTGYRPIIDACQKVLEELSDHSVAAGSSAIGQCRDAFDPFLSETLSVLHAIRENKSDATQRSPSHFFLPSTLDELDQLLSEHPDARLLAGGTDLALEVTQQLKTIDKIVYLSKVRELSVVTLSDDQCQLGAAVPLTECMALLGSVFSDLKHLLLRFGSMQVRNQGTLGGNIANASPIGDMPPVLLALDATLLLRSKEGTRELPIEEFFVAYRETALRTSEYIQQIRINNLGDFIGEKPNARLHIYKVSKRLDDDISTVCGAFNVALTDGRIESAKMAFGGMASMPLRAVGLEAAIVGQKMSPELIARAKQALASDFAPIDDARGTAHYRQQVAGNLLDRLYHEWANPNVGTQVLHYVG